MFHLVASILDHPHPGLDNEVWSQDGYLLPEHKKLILDTLNSDLSRFNLKGSDKWIKRIKIIGGMTTYQYTFDSDLDIHIEVDLPKFIETNMPGVTEQQAHEHLDATRKLMNKTSTFLQNTKHPIEFYFETPFVNPEGSPRSGLYDLMLDQWLILPISVDKDFDAETIYATIIDVADKLAQELDLSFGKINRDIRRIEDLQDVISAWGNEQRQVFQQKLEQKLKSVEDEVRKLIELRDKLVLERRNYSPESEQEIKFKYLQRFGYLTILSALREFIIDDQKITPDEIPQIKEIIQEASKKNKWEGKGKLMIDFDNTIADNSKEEYPDMGDPFPNVREALEKLKNDGWEIVIYSCRANEAGEMDKIKKFMNKHELPYDDIFEGKPQAEYYIDDRNIVFTNWKEVVDSIDKPTTKTAQHGVKYDYTSTQFNMPKDISQEIVEWSVGNIPDEDLYDDGSGKFERELESHMTILFGLLTNDSSDVEELLKDEKPIRLKFGKTDIFEAPEKDAVFIEVDSPDAIRLHEKLMKLKNENQQPDYSPHVTIAYVKKGCGKKYIGKTLLDELEIELDTLKFSPKDGDPVFIHLGNQKKEASLMKIAKLTWFTPDGQIHREFELDPAKYPEFLSKGWVAIQDDNPRKVVVLVDEVEFAPEYLNDFLADVAEYGSYVTIQDKHGNQVQLRYPFKNLQRLVRHKLYAPESTANKEASTFDTRTAYWISPDGEINELEEGEEHWDWVYNYKLENDIKETADSLWNTLIQDGWIRAIKSDNGLLFELQDMKNLPPFLEEFVIEHPSREILIEDHANGSVLFSYEDAVEYGLQKAVNKNLQQKRLVPAKQASWGFRYWISPEGEIIKLENGETHEDWVMGHLYDLGYPKEEHEYLDYAAVQGVMFEKGWIRIGDVVYQHTDQRNHLFAITIDNLKNIPPVVDDFIADHFSEGGIIEVSNVDGGDFLEIDNPFPTIQKAVNKAVAHNLWVKADFMPSIIPAPQNKWQSDSDVEIPVDPDTLHDEPNYFAPHADKPRDRSWIRKIIDWFKSDPQEKKADATDEILKLIESTGGATWNFSKGNMAGTPTYAVSIFPEKSVILDHFPTKEELEKYIQTNSDMFDGETSLGVWHDKSSNKVYLDVVKTIENRDEAIALGKKYNQIGIFDLKNFEEIPTGGTGEVQSKKADSVIALSGWLAPDGEWFEKKSGKIHSDVIWSRIDELEEKYHLGLKDSGIEPTDYYKTVGFLLKKGWSRFSWDYKYSSSGDFYTGVEVFNLQHLPNSLKSFLVQHIPSGEVVVIEGMENRKHAVVEFPVDNLQEAVDRDLKSLVPIAASLGLSKKAYSGNSAWVEPNGTVHSFSAYLPHGNWVVQHLGYLESKYRYNFLKDLRALDPKPGHTYSGSNITESVDKLIENGWVRVNGIGQDFSIQISDLLNPPGALQMFLDEYYDWQSETPVLMDDLQGRYAEVDVTGNVTKDIHKALQRKRISTLEKAAKSFLINGVKVFENPSVQEARNLRQKAKEKSLRVFVDPFTHDVYVWDAYFLNHEDVYNFLGYKYEQIPDENLHVLYDEEDIESYYGQLVKADQEVKHNTTWDDPRQDGEPFSPLPVTFTKDINEDNLNWRYPWKYMRRPYGPYHSNDEEVNRMLMEMPLSKREGKLFKVAGLVMWIDPSGQEYNLQGRAHYTWIEDNLEMLRTDYDLKFKDPGRVYKEMLKQGWTRVTDDSGNLGIEVWDWKNIPHYLDQFLSKYYFKGETLSVEQFGKEFLLDIIDPFPTLQKAVNKTLYELKSIASLGLSKRAFTLSGYWVAPDGKGFEVRTGRNYTHGDWVWNHRKELIEHGISPDHFPKNRIYFDYEGAAIEMLQKGWSRVGDIRGHYGAEVADVRHVPQGLENFFPTVLKDKDTVVVADLDKKAVQVEYPWKSLQNAVNQAFRRRQFAKKAVQWGADYGVWISPEGDTVIMESDEEHADWAFEYKRKDVDDLIREGWTRVRTYGGEAFVEVKDKTNIPQFVDKFFYRRKYDPITVEQFGETTPGGNFVRVSYSTFIELGLNEAVRRELRKPVSAVAKLAHSLFISWWVDPSGKVYQSASTHAIWVITNIDMLETKYGYHIPLDQKYIDRPEEYAYADPDVHDVVLGLVEKGWTRVFSSGGSVSFQINNINNPPRNVQNLYKDIISTEPTSITIGDMRGRNVQLVPPYYNFVGDVQRALRMEKESSTYTDKEMDKILTEQHEMWTDEGGGFTPRDWNHNTTDFPRPEEERKSPFTLDRLDPKTPVPFPSYEVTWFISQPKGDDTH